MKLIVGLGNPGTKYQKTRHNLGFLIIDEIAVNFQFSINFQSIFNAKISKKIIKNQKIILAKPQTLMNNSGQAVQKMVKYYKIPIEDIIIIHDEIDLLLGEIKIQKGRGAAGHNGVQSIIDQLGAKDFVRMRIGIKPIDGPKERIINTEKFVLKNFTSEEKDIIEQIIEKAAQIIITALNE
ncbi:MAG: aminoacyl-tRNA hydrolase [Parcubacteria group bacterium]|jgi:PTH1 family peptidyl-tRNA hydrolase|nr:aminoacyl-tRNA hydrolase [Parcubacteria group bacterium]|tara:strand:- start:40 stop:582 length:543 start_codon:yes stop_codon:yes gene_type:complete